MSTTTRVIKASPATVWEVLSDGWLYPVWVVGASRMREVDLTWPEVGSQLHHSVGAWPLLINDNTEVTESRHEQVLGLRGRGWPAGEVDIEIRLRPVGSDTEVAIDEDAAAGPGLLIPKPLRGLTFQWRNVETLRRLAYIAERRVTAPTES
ncbi:SRPBCC family protein [Nocardioides cynanchi]|uniref:SRPBCC family protein n=1 Tax=Nocardioides cynanchi TaxID=2558918 RepID=UPI0012484AE4|nr:SRPBCC family protein [Nocardioides cynanchi]